MYSYGLDKEERFERIRVSPKDAKARNPAFDITPAKYVTGIITEKGIFTFNKFDEVLSCNELDESMDSRLEVITTEQTALNQIVDILENTLFAEK